MIIEHLWIPCVHEFLEKYFHFLIIYIRILMKCFFNTCFILLYSYKDYRYYSLLFKYFAMQIMSVSMLFFFCDYKLIRCTNQIHEISK